MPNTKYDIYVNIHIRTYFASDCEIVEVSHYGNPLNNRKVSIGPLGTWIVGHCVMSNSMIAINDDNCIHANTIMFTDVYVIS